MNALVDTNILVRLSDSGHPLQSVCELALQRLLQRQDRVFLCAQVAIEFRAVATRPKSINGLGLSPTDAEIGLRRAGRWLVWLPEPADIGVRWRALVNKHSVLGKQAHDTRLVALMEAHGLTYMLSLNARDFARFPGVICVEPADVR
ncbi:MAG: PIN domain-containing protein [Verrucomicrobia bacterium]|nr:PIN domain-containing protein [Verrucomicrobiota bacterium]